MATPSPDSFGADVDRFLLQQIGWMCRGAVTARVGCPGEALQLAQFAAIHAHWATIEEETEPRIVLFKKDRVLVPAEALALQSRLLALSLHWSASISDSSRQTPASVDRRVAGKTIAEQRAATIGYSAATPQAFPEAARKIDKQPRQTAG